MLEILFLDCSATRLLLHRYAKADGVDFIRLIVRQLWHKLSLQISLKKKKQGDKHTLIVCDKLKVAGGPQRAKIELKFEIFMLINLLLDIWGHPLKIWVRSVNWFLRYRRLNSQRGVLVAMETHTRSACSVVEFSNSSSLTLNFLLSRFPAFQVTCLHKNYFGDYILLLWASGSSRAAPWSLKETEISRDSTKKCRCWTRRASWCRQQSESVFEWCEHHRPHRFIGWEFPGFLGFAGWLKWHWSWSG